jgi:succinyl-diaminopimelate desuccinylase
MESAVTQEIISFTQELVRIPTVNPPGKNYRAVVRLLKEKCDQLGLECTVVECDSLPSLVGGEGKGVLHFHGHYDVVQADANQFNPYTRSGNIYGRGSSDMKSGLAAMVYAAHVLNNSKITFSITPDEETGGTHGVQCLLDRSIIAPKAVIMPEASSNKIWNGCRGAFAVEITVKGRSAHAVYPHLGSNAFLEMLEVAQELKKIDPGRGTLLLGGALKGGTQFNMVPEACSFTVDWRFPPSQSVTDIKERVSTLVDTLKEGGKHIDTRVLLETDGFCTLKHEEICTVLTDAVEKIRGFSSYEICPGFLDIRHFAHKGIPAVAFGPGLLEVAHGPEEYVKINDVIDAFHIYVAVGRTILERL